jgi:hypothetical protein
MPMELIHLRHLGMVFGSSRQPSRQAAPWIPPQRAHSGGHRAIAGQPLR